MYRYIYSDWDDMCVFVSLNVCHILQLLVCVEVEGGSVVEVTVREGAPVITVMFRVAEAAGLTLEPTSSLFEIASHLKLRELTNGGRHLTSPLPPSRPPFLTLFSSSLPHFHLPLFSSPFLAPLPLSLPSLSSSLPSPPPLPLSALPILSPLQTVP